MPKITSVNDCNFIPYPSHTARLAQALVRDNWRCVVTGTTDRRAPKRILAQLDPMAPAIYTQCAHIIPKAMYFGVEPKSKENTKVHSHRCSHYSEKLTSGCLT